MDTSNVLFEIDTAGWIAQHSGRDLTEVVREILQNSLDTGEDITVKIDTRGKRIEVIDDGPGFEKLEHAWQVFGGDKADDPEKRGRFGRGLKELVASTEATVVETVGGRVEFDVETEERTIYPDKGRDSGTRIVARNSEWKMRDVKDVYHYVKEFWPPSGQTITVDLKGGDTEVVERPAPTHTEGIYMPTVVVNDDGQVDQEKRRGRVNVRPAAGNSGVLYEMGIPVVRFADYPFHVDVQQKIPLAEQRNEPDERWHQRYLIPGLLEMVIDDLSKAQLRKEWAVGAIEATFKNELKEHYVETVVRDGRKKDLVVSSGEAADDKCENHGYQVFDTGRASSATASIVKSVAKSSREIAGNLEEREKERVAPTSAQRSFIETMESLARDIGFDQVSIETWKIEESFSDDTSLAQYNNEEGIVRLNVNEASWDELRPQLVGTVFHELAHINTTGHGTPFRDELERIAGAATIELLEQDDG